MGLEGLKLLREVGDETGLLVITEVMEISQIELMLPYIDCFQVGARNMQNFNLLRELGHVRKPVLLKRGIAATIEEVLLSAEYILSGGNYDLMLCERGIRTFETYTRNTMDISAIPVLKKLTHLPVFGDPSHGVGIRDLVPPMALAAVAAGADGLLMEMHPNPDKAMSDGAHVGSVKGAVYERASLSFGSAGQAEFLPGHPMAGKEVHGAEHADAGLFQGAVWLFTPLANAAEVSDLQAEWRAWVTKFGCRTLDLDPARHDEICAWVSHLPQFVSTAMSALLEEKFAGDEEMRAIGGRALREMTRLGASPYSMWRDVAQTNTAAIAETLLALEQRLTHIRENLKTPELREEFELANRFRANQTKR
jgi:3-deoxy-7-phosphoheptulonate synthase